MQVIKPAQASFFLSRNPTISALALLVMFEDDRIFIWDYDQFFIWYFVFLKVLKHPQITY